MADDPANDPSSPGVGERPKRPPPTIDLNASEISDETQNSDTGESNSRGGNWNMKAAGAKRATLRWIVPAISGAVAALIVLGIVWASSMTGPVTPQAPVQTAEAQATAARIDELSGRLTGVETKLAQSAAPTADAEMRGRVAQIENGLAALRSETVALRQQIDSVAAAANALKSAPRDAASPDLSALTERLSRVEQSVVALPSQMQSVSRSAERSDASLQRLAVATVLESKVRAGLPYADALAAAKKLADNTDTLAPLDAFAASGIPTDAALAKDLLALLSQLAPQPPAQKTVEGTNSGSAGMLDRLLAGGARLVRIERADAPGAAIPSTPKFAALEDAAGRNDIIRARNELSKQSDEVKTRTQRWSAAVDARDAALKAAGIFASDALAAVSNPAQ